MTNMKSCKFAVMLISIVKQLSYPEVRATSIRNV